MSKTTLTFHELIELIDASVKSKKIEKDYSDFLKSCQDLGISSYILNTIIVRAKEGYSNNDNNNEDVDFSFFVPSRPKQEKKDENTPKEIQVVTKVERKTSKTAWFLILFAIGCCIAEAVYIYNINEDKKWYSRKLDESNNRSTELSNTLTTISDMTSDLSDDSSFNNWHSSNHEKSSESHNNYSFTASKGDKLSFNYYVSSEANYDYLTITLSGDSISTNELVKVSGDSHNSRVFVFKKGGGYNLQVKYSKDSSVDENNDNAGVSNISLHRNYKNLLDNIHSISDINH